MLGVRKKASGGFPPARPPDLSRPVDQGQGREGSVLRGHCWFIQAQSESGGGPRPASRDPALPAGVRPDRGCARPQGALGCLQ